jgi:uroporphyrinogen decarboxylase
VPITDSPWVSTVARWRKEGLPADVSPAEYFDYELIRLGPDQSPQFPSRTVREDARYVIETTPYGGVVRNRKDYASVPDVLEYPCKTRDDWEQKIKPRLVAGPGRVDWKGEWPRGFAGDQRQQEIQVNSRAEALAGLPAYQQARQEGKAVAYFAHIGSGHVHQSYLDTESLLVNVIEDPAWLIDMYETTAGLVMQMYDIMVAGGFEFDAAFLACDLGFNHGPFYSPKHFEQQLHPTFARLFGFFHERGIPVILHSDGRVLRLIPYFLEEGLDCLNPLEVKAGMDLIELKKQYGDRLAFMGGIDVQAMADPDPRVIEEEIRTKITVAKQGGGYIYHSDHSVPVNVTFTQYRRVIDLVRQYGAYS